jgi:hypothetical protein
MITRFLEVNEIECVTGKGIRGDRFFQYKLGDKGHWLIRSSALADDCLFVR